MQNRRGSQDDQFELSFRGRNKVFGPQFVVIGEKTQIRTLESYFRIAPLLLLHQNLVEALIANFSAWEAVEDWPTQ
ncbi:hypothetical protein Scep_013089 [Stephania cephalantha]|uniref:Uncharacterized protein n=1 Tax=Stephania cephalantha TaxID=152367 RepID=A0AAP0JHN1_9MAGN